MKTLLPLAVAALMANVAIAVQPRGTVMELHSCELFAGGCTVSSEAPLDGRYMVRAWNFTGGSFEGTDLAGLRLVLLQSSPDNLAADKTASDRAVIYLPEGANAAQERALQSWLTATLPDLKGSRVQTRVARIRFGTTATGYTLNVGDFVSVKTASLESCDSGGCGEALWYTPRSYANVFTVAVNRSSQVNEPLLRLSWSENSSRRSVFLGKFGDDTKPKDIYVTAADLCGPAQKLF